MPAAPPDWDFSFRDDFLVADGIETVTLVRQNADASDREDEDGRGFWESPDLKTLSLVGAVDRVWNLFADDFADPVTTPILPADRVRDHTGAEWVVQRATLDGIGDQWRLDCTRAVAQDPRP